MGIFTLGEGVFPKRFVVVAFVIAFCSLGVSLKECGLSLAIGFCEDREGSFVLEAREEGPGESGSGVGGVWGRGERDEATAVDRLVRQ